MEYGNLEELAFNRDNVCGSCEVQIDLLISIDILFQFKSWKIQSYSTSIHISRNSFRIETFHRKECSQHRDLIKRIL